MVNFPSICASFVLFVIVLPLLSSSPLRAGEPLSLLDVQGGSAAPAVVPAGEGQELYRWVQTDRERMTPGFDPDLDAFVGGNFSASTNGEPFNKGQCMGVCAFTAAWFHGIVGPMMRPDVYARGAASPELQGQACRAMGARFQLPLPVSEAGSVRLRRFSTRYAQRVEQAISQFQATDFMRDVRQVSAQELCDFVEICLSAGFQRLSIVGFWVSEKKFAHALMVYSMDRGLAQCGTNPPEVAYRLRIVDPNMATVESRTSPHIIYIPSAKQLAFPKSIVGSYGDWLQRGRFFSGQWGICELNDICSTPNVLSLIAKTGDSNGYAISRGGDLPVHDPDFRATIPRDAADTKKRCDTYIRDLFLVDGRMFDVKAAGAGYQANLQRDGRWVLAIIKQRLLQEPMVSRANQLDPGIHRELGEAMDTLMCPFFLGSFPRSATDFRKAVLEPRLKAQLARLKTALERVKKTAEQPGGSYVTDGIPGDPTALDAQRAALRGDMEASQRLAKRAAASLARDSLKPKDDVSAPTVSDARRALLRGYPRAAWDITKEVFRDTARRL